MREHGEIEHAHKARFISFRGSATSETAGSQRGPLGVSSKEQEEGMHHQMMLSCQQPGGVGPPQAGSANSASERAADPSS